MVSEELISCTVTGVTLMWIVALWCRGGDRDSALEAVRAGAAVVHIRLLNRAGTMRRCIRNRCCPFVNRMRIR